LGGYFSDETFPQFTHREGMLSLGLQLGLGLGLGPNTHKWLLQVAAWLLHSMVEEF
jgi:hypothetical protein